MRRRRFLLLSLSLASSLFAAAATCKKRPELRFVDVDGSHPVVVTVHEFSVTKLEPRILRITIDAGAAEQLATLSRAIVGHRLGVEVDGKVLQTPTVRIPIDGRDFQLSYDNDSDYAEAYAALGGT